MHAKRRQLYYELLEEGIYSDYIYETVPHTLHELNTVFQAGLSEDYVLLYGNYVPMDLEKMLVLKKKTACSARYRRMKSLPSFLKMRFPISSAIRQ